MLSLNLLPWRLEQHQKAFRRFMWQGLNLASLFSFDCCWIEPTQ